jgi:DNA-binding transcriptional LysR family regulator
MNYAVDARLVAGSGNVLTRAAVAGLGIVQTFEYHVAAELARGELELLLEEYEPEPRGVHALFARQKSAVPKVRVFIDFLAELFAFTPANLTGRKRR